ncbi:MAG: 5-formyltetrahydrofolate cyclo-ligase [Bacteroidales bacterium]|nr:5-formyltetrahydrofolate cyclo-ligase [Candidatus Cacconaster equi]
MDKKGFRSSVLKEVSLIENRAVDELWRQVEKLPQFVSARTVLTFWSMPDEVPTEEFILKWSGSKRIVLPLVVGENLVLKEFSGKECLVSGYKGILEPSVDALTVAPDEIDFAIVPGVAFDVNCNRMGRGKGFYDRTLPLLKCFTAGVGYDCQLFERIPVDPWDVPLNAVITPSRQIGADL